MQEIFMLTLPQYLATGLASGIHHRSADETSSEAFSIDASYSNHVAVFDQTTSETLFDFIVSYTRLE